jgi:outer membrane protein insertion porin family
MAVPATLIAQEADSGDGEWYLGKPIAEVRFSGLRHVPESELTPIVSPYLEQPFTLDLFWELQGKLYATDQFDGLESNAVAADAARSAVIVEFIVQERPLVAEILVTGNQRVRTGDILAEVLIQRGDPFDTTALATDEANVRALYLGRGYPDVVVSTDIDRDEAGGEVAVTFEVAEGVLVTVEDLEFVGNEFASDGTLRRRMRTKPRSLFSSGAFRESALQDDQQLIEHYYASNGFVDAKVERIERELRADDREDRRSMILTVYVNEGRQYLYGGMTFAGNELFTTEELLELVRHRPDTVVNRETVDADFLRIQDLYFENGYIFNLIELEERRDEVTATISFHVTIVEQDRAHIENIILSGNEKTRDSVLLRELPFEVGDVFNKAQIVQGLRNLYNTQFFSVVEPETPPGRVPGLMDVVINVEEQSTADINFGISFGGADFPLSGSVRWNERNFLGGGQALGAGLEVSPVKQTVTLSFTEPWLLGLRWSGGVELGVERIRVRNVPQDVLPPVFPDDALNPVPDPYRTEAEYQAAGNVLDERYAMEYNEWAISLGVSTSYRNFPPPFEFLGIGGGLATSLEFLTYDAEKFRPFNQLLREERLRWVLVNRLRARVSWDQRDIFYNPTEGFLLSQSATFTGGFLFGNRHYVRLDSRAEAFVTLLQLPVFANWDLKLVLAAHSGFSVILPQIWVPEGRHALEIDSTDLLIIDGSRIGRGWRLARTGRARWNNQVELRVPIAEQILWAVLFLDGTVLWTPTDIPGKPGKLSQEIAATSLDDFYFSYGLGIRFSIPQFPIRIYLASRFRFDDAGRIVRPERHEGDLEIFGLPTQFVITLGGDVF